MMATHSLKLTVFCNRRLFFWVGIEVEILNSGTMGRMSPSVPLTSHNSAYRYSGVISIITAKFYIDQEKRFYANLV